MTKLLRRGLKTALALGAALLAHSALATEISIVSNDWLVASPSLTQIIEARSAVPLDFACRPLQVHPLEDGLLVITTNPTCRGGDVAPLWVVDPVTSTVIVEGTGSVIQTTRPGFGRPLITFLGGRVGIGHEERWEHRDGRYSRRFYRAGVR